MTNSTNATLGVENDPNVKSVPVTRIQFSDGNLGVESCWELTDQEIKALIETRRMYLIFVGTTHPPVLPSVYSSLMGIVDQEEIQ
jgi:hypothetical protein